MQKKKCYLDIEQNLTIVLIKTDSNTTTRIGHNNQNLVLTYAELFKTSNGNRHAFTGKDQKCAFCGKEHKYGKRVHFENLISLLLHQIKRKFFWEKFLKLKAALTDHTKWNQLMERVTCGLVLQTLKQHKIKRWNSIKISFSNFDFCVKGF